MKLWIDDVRPAPDGYIWCKSTNEALRFITRNKTEVWLIDLDHDAGEFVQEGGDFINVLKEIERLAHSQLTLGMAWRFLLRDQIEFRLHSANPVGVQNMRAIIQANGWKEVFR